MEQEEEWEREGLLDPAWEKQQKKVSSELLHSHPVSFCLPNCEISRLTSCKLCSAVKREHLLYSIIALLLQLLQLIIIIIPLLIEFPYPHTVLTSEALHGSMLM